MPPKKRPSKRDLEDGGSKGGKKKKAKLETPARVSVMINIDVDPVINVEAEAKMYSGDRTRLVTITATATDSNPGAADPDKRVAYCTAYLLRRDEDEGFTLPVEEMDEESAELSDLATNLFNSHGFLKGRFAESGTRAWAGDWAHELHAGDILFVQEMLVEPAYQRQGVGRRMVSKVLESARSLSGGHECFGIVCPGVMTVAVERDELGAGEGAARSAADYKALATTFWRHMGFGRIGTSKWFGFAQAPDHPSKHMDDSHVLEDMNGDPRYDSEPEPNEEDYDSETWACAKQLRIHPDDVDLSDPLVRLWGTKKGISARKRRDPLYWMDE